MSRWEITAGDGPIIATAIHAGHEIREEVGGISALDDSKRLMEEDPFTDSWLSVGDHKVATTMSRFEVDLNRPREKAIYRTPDDAWGLDLWKSPLPDEQVEASLALYDDFYADMTRLCDKVVAQHGRFVLLDLHSYNHRRQGPTAPVDDPELNPEINVGTGSLDRSTWGGVVDSFSEAMAGHPFDGGFLDVRENVKFKGGHLSNWINDRYTTSGCALAIEVKKFYMDEWSGSPVESVIVSVEEALTVAVGAVRQSLT